MDAFLRNHKIEAGKWFFIIEIVMASIICLVAVLPSSSCNRDECVNTYPFEGSVLTFAFTLALLSIFVNSAWWIGKIMRQNSRWSVIRLMSGTTNDYDGVTTVHILLPRWPFPSAAAFLFLIAGIVAANLANTWEKTKMRNMAPFPTWVAGSFFCFLLSIVNMAEIYFMYQYPDNFDSPSIAVVGMY